MKIIKMILAFIGGALAMYLCLSFLGASFDWVFVNISNVSPENQVVYIFGRLLVIIGGVFASIEVHLHD